MIASGRNQGAGWFRRAARTNIHCFSRATGGVKVQPVPFSIGGLPKLRQHILAMAINENHIATFVVPDGDIVTTPTIGWTGGGRASHRKTAVVYDVTGIRDFPCIVWLMGGFFFGK